MKNIALLIVCLFFGAALGGLARTEIIAFCSSFSFPLGVLLANMLGSFLIGLYYSTPKNKNSYASIFFATAFLGSLTTFSAFIHDIFLITVIHARQLLSFSPQFAEYLNQHPFSELNIFHAILNAVLNLVLCLVCVYLGKKRGFIRFHEQCIR